MCVCERESVCVCVCVCVCVLIDFYFQISLLSFPAWTIKSTDNNTDFMKLAFHGIITQ